MDEDRENKAQSSIDAEPDKITPRHRALMRKLVAGMKLGEACDDIGMSISRASVVVNSPLFQREMEKMQEELNGKFTSAEAEKVSDATREKLNDSAERAAATLRGALDDASSAVRISAAKDILDRTGYGKEDKVKANIVVEPSPSLLNVIERIGVEKGRKEEDE